MFSPAVHRVAPIAASMAIARPEAIDDALALASRSAAEDGGRRLFCFAMQSRLRRRKIAGGRRCGIGDRGAAGLRPDQAIRGSVERTRPGQPWGDTCGSRHAGTRRRLIPSGKDPPPRTNGGAGRNRRKDGTPSSPGIVERWRRQDRCQQPQLHLGGWNPKLIATVQPCSIVGRHIIRLIRRREYRPDPLSLVPGVAGRSRKPIHLRQGSSPQGRNGDAGSGAADESGSKGDTQTFISAPTSPSIN